VVPRTLHGLRTPSGARAACGKAGTFTERVKKRENTGSKAVLFLDSREDMWHFKGLRTATNSLQV